MNRLALRDVSPGLSDHSIDKKKQPLNSKKKSNIGRTKQCSLKDNLYSSSSSKQHALSCPNNDAPPIPPIPGIDSVSERK